MEFCGIGIAFRFEWRRKAILLPRMKLATEMKLKLFIDK
jgi:hypothetical protein